MARSRSWAGTRARVLGAVPVLAAFGAGWAAAQGVDTTPPSPLPLRARLWVRPAASLVVPGSGQLLAGQDRGALYLASELFFLSQFVRLNQVAHQQADRLRDLAFDVARRSYAPSPAVRDTAFEYFEQMGEFSSSGAFNRGTGPSFVPEGDPATYNGAMWLLARRTFWDDPNVPPPPGSPQYLRALQFYFTRAVGPNFLWSWRDAALEQQEYRRAIRRSDDAFRQAQNQVGLLLANHLVSAIDALISNRLSAAAGRPAQLSTTLGPRHALLHVRFAF